MCHISLRELYSYSRFLFNLSSWLGWAFLICFILFIVIMTINDKGGGAGLGDLEC